MSSTYSIGAALPTQTPGSHVRADPQHSAVLLDIDGTLAPIVRHAADAHVPEATRALLIEISREDAPVHSSMLPVTVSEHAAEYLADQLAKHPSAVAVLLIVEPAGCSGHGYRIEPSDVIRDEDSVFETRRLRIVIDAASMPYLQGTRLDVSHQGLVRRVIFDNPNARQTCGCGESFGVLTSSDRRTWAES